ncbi:MAG: pirin-like C-terminal cupin domain-containing protein, partial [Nitrososphaeraceae archaeon]
MTVTNTSFLSSSIYECQRKTNVSGDDGEEVEISAPADSITTTNNSALDILLIGGLPLNEPVARYGPYVMNT